MKNWKISALLKTPLGTIIVVGAIVLCAELLFMLSLREFPMVQAKFPDTAWDFIDAVTLTAIISPALYFLVFRKIQKSEQRHRRIMQTSMDGFWITDTMGCILDVNDAYCQLIGYAREELLNMRITDVEAKETPEQTAQHIREIMTKGHVRFETRHRRKDGQLIDIEVSSVHWTDKNDGRFFVFLRDVSERKNAELLLSKSESRFRNLVETTNDWIWEVDEHTVYTYASPRIHDILGYEAAEIIGKRPFDFMPPEEAKRVADIFDLIAAARISFASLENTNLHKDGHPVVLETNGTPVIDSKGRFCGYRGIDRDVTERKRMDASLSNSEARLQTIVESLTEGIAVSDLSGQLLHFNRAALDLHGFTTLDECRQHLTMFADTFELSAMDGTIWPVDKWPLARVLRGENLRDLEAYVRHIQAGWQRVFNYGGTLIRDAYGQPLMAILTISDVTERKRMEKELRENEARYRRITEALTDYQYKVRIENGLAVETTQNPACVTVTGYTMEEFAANPHLWIQMVVPEDRELVMEYVRQILAGKDASPIEHRITRKDGKIRWISDTTILFRDASGKLLSYDGVIKDITERKQAEDAVLRLNAELEEKVRARTKDLELARLEANRASQAKSDFLANMSHEIRTPMNGVIGMIDVLQQSSLKGPQIEMVNIIHDSAFSLLAILDDILDFSKIEAGKLQIDLMPMDIANVVEGVGNTLDNLARKKDVELTVFVDPAITARVMGDAGRLRQILVNLAGNAIKFSCGQGRQGKVSLRARLADNAPKRITLEFRIADNGIGIDEATQARLFTAFTQGDASTTRKFGGTGLGLAISSQLVNLMDGVILVQSTPGKGSLFSVRLPFELITKEINGAEAPSSGAKTPVITGISCLVTGGPEGLAEDLASYLKYAGAAVERAARLEAALVWIGSRPPGLYIIVIDTAGDALSLDELRAAGRAQTGLSLRFVVIGRGKRRRCRSEAADLFLLDGNVMRRHAFLQTIAVAAGLAEEDVWAEPPDNTVTRPAPLSREEARRRGSLILIAEDNENNQKVILQQLNLLGMTADIANDGKEALQLWQSGDYAILFTDLHMPEMDGYELTVAIRTGVVGRAHAPIIAFTANALKGEEDHCRSVGMDDYITKPVQLINLKAILNKWLPMVDEPMPISALTPSAQTAAPVPVDVNVLKSLVGDDEAVINEFLHDFRLSARKIADSLRAAAVAGLAKDAGAAAHKLKSSARSVGAIALGEWCAKIEDAGTTGDAAALNELLPGFVKELALVDEYLDSL